MFTLLINIIKRNIPRFLIIFKSFKQNMDLRRIISKEDLMYLNKNQVKETKKYWGNITTKCNINFIKYYS